MKSDYEIFYVSLKILLRKENKILVLIDAVDDCYDFPGGRIDNVEADVPLEKILDREVKEELGPDLKYKLGKPIIQYRSHNEERNIFVFVTVYEAFYISGEPKLSSEHTSYEWVDPRSWKPEKDKFKNEEQFQALQRYFQTL